MRNLTLILFFLGMTIVGSCAYLATGLSGVETRLVVLTEHLPGTPTQVSNRVTIEPMTYITKYKYDDDDNLILQATFCYNANDPNDIQRIRDEWQKLCDEL